MFDNLVYLLLTVWYWGIAHWYVVPVVVIAVCVAALWSAWTDGDRK